MTNIKFAKVHKDAKIPSKRVEDAGYDVYARFDKEYMVIPPHYTKMIPTGIASACDDDYCFALRERGSTGTKGIALRAGIIDAGFRNEWFVPLTNTTDKYMFITKLPDEETYKKYWGAIMSPSFCYPYHKAIAQALLIPVPKTTVEEIPYDELLAIKSERGLGSLGSSNK